MSDRKHLVFTLVCFYGVSAALGCGVVANSMEQSHALKHAAELSTFTNKLTDTVANTGKKVLRWGLSWLMINPSAIEGSGEYDRAVVVAERHGHFARFYATFLGFVVALFCFYLQQFVPERIPNGRQVAVRHLCGASLVLFAVGVAATALSLIAFKDMPVIGQVVFKFESKGIAQTIHKLFTSGNAVLGGLIFLFSIAVPLAKVGLTLFATYTHGPQHDKAMKIIKAVGKWSMADVFVIAVLLAFFAIGGDEFTDAWVGPGVYFFAAYCILSMWAGVWLAGTHATTASGVVEKSVPVGVHS
ncbi:MAG: paraquat-inducible protein A [Pirellulales bacterium]